MPTNPLNLYTSQILQDELAKQAREKPGQLTLDEAHLAQLLGLVNEERGPRSHLPEMPRQKLTDPAFINLLADKGWLVAAGKDGKLHPTAHSRRSVLALLKPDTSIQLVLGKVPNGQMLSHHPLACQQWQFPDQRLDQGRFTRTIHTQ